MANNTSPSRAAIRQPGQRNCCRCVSGRERLPPNLNCRMTSFLALGSAGASPSQKSHPLLVKSLRSPDPPSDRHHVHNQPYAPRSGDRLDQIPRVLQRLDVAQSSDRHHLFLPHSPSLPRSSLITPTVRSSSPAHTTVCASCGGALGPSLIFSMYSWYSMYVLTLRQ